MPQTRPKPQIADGPPTMLFTTCQPAPPLAPFVTLLWHLVTPEPRAGLQRVLPGGRAELVLNLAADTLTECTDAGPVGKQAPALLSGVRATYSVIDTRDLRELMGVVFAPGALPMFFAQPANLLQGETPLELLWGSEVASLRDHLRNKADLQHRFDILSGFLLGKLRPHRLHPAVQEELVRRTSPRRLVTLPAKTRLSTRRTRDLFAESIGVTPKSFARIWRFREAVDQLHTGNGVRWAELALGLGYYDQAHFNADFRAFSGLCPSAYMQADRPWSTHVALKGGTAV